jgi:hypothetical protein
MPRKINKRKKIQKIKRAAGLAPPERKSIYDRGTDHERITPRYRSLQDMLTVHIGDERNW